VDNEKEGLLILRRTNVWVIHKWTLLYTSKRAKGQ